MKLLSGLALFLLCGLAGESKARRLQHRERTLFRLYGLIREISDRQLSNLMSFREGALLCSPSPERDQLLRLESGETVPMPLLTMEERERVRSFARMESRSVAALRQERDALLTQLQQERNRAREELDQKGRIYRSVGVLCGAAALLMIL